MDILKKTINLIFAMAAFAALIVFPDAAAAAVIKGLETCGKIIIPSLFPFFIAVFLLSALGASDFLGRLFSPFFSKLFGVSSAGASAFVIGLLGGYPMGAAYINDLYSQGKVITEESERLCIFCNNSGPAFILGAVGFGALGSPAAGFFLYGVHILAAAIYGIFCRQNDFEIVPVKISPAHTESFSAAFIRSVKSAVEAIIKVCGFVLCFSVIIGVLDSRGLLFNLAGSMALHFGGELRFFRALITGVFELGNAISAMQGFSITPLNLGLAAFILSWGGLSVHFQTLAIAPKIKAARYIIGRLIIAIYAFVISFFGAVLIL